LLAPASGSTSEPASGKVSQRRQAALSLSRTIRTRAARDRTSRTRTTTSAP
jgi:hypothetical protein